MEFKPFVLADAMNAGNTLALNQFKLNEAQNQVRAKDALRSAASGAPGAAERYKQEFPVESMEWEKRTAEHKKLLIDYHLSQMNVVGQLASGVTDQPSYQRAIQKAQSLGIDVSEAPPNFDPNWVKQMQAQALTTKQKLELAKEQFERGFKERDLSIKERTRDEVERHNRAMEARTNQKPPAGYMWNSDVQGNPALVAVPGGPADQKLQEKREKSNAAVANAKAKAERVTTKVDEALGQVGFFSTGLTGAILGQVPGRGAYNLRRTVDTIKAILGFNELQEMRNASPTGGALGQVAVQELNMLQSTLASLDANQSEDQLVSNLKQVKKHYDNWKNAVTSASGNTPNGAPNVGHVEEGYRFKGGDPADPNSWEKVN